jgi:perosamine synthetase
VRLNNRARVGRDELMQELLDRGVSSRRGVMAIHREAPFRSEEWERRLPVTNLVVETTLILPLFHDFTEEEQDYVINCITHLGARASTAGS